MRPAWRIPAIALGAAFGVAMPVFALEPYQMVRSMQLIQDRVANGDHAAMPMQLRLLGMIDRHLRDAPPADFEDRRNMEALFIYAMSGGNPTTLDFVLGRLGPGTQQDAVLARAIGQYLRGDIVNAMSTLGSIEPRTYPQSSAPFIALVKGSVFAGENPKLAVEMFDFARLQSPGTLIEEAALRRSLAAAAKLRDAPRFLRSSSQYARRFIRSPYATQFADELVKGIVALSDAIDFAQIEATVSLMSPAHQKVVYLRLARVSAIEGLKALSDFASAKAAGYGETATDGSDTARLYAGLQGVATETAEQTLTELKSIDRQKLTSKDQQLLDAAIAIASGVVAPPPDPGPLPATAKDPSPERLEALPAPAATPSEPPPPTTRVILPGPPPPDPVIANKLPQTDAPPMASSGNAVSPPEIQADEPLKIVSDTRRKLDEIDKLLTETQ